MEQIMADPAAKEHMAKKVRLEYLQHKCLDYFLLHFLKEYIFFFNLLGCLTSSYGCHLKKKKMHPYHIKSSKLL